MTLLNSFSTFKKFVLSVSLILLTLCLCSCSKVSLYQIKTLTVFSGENISATYSYTYTSDFKPAIITAKFEDDINEDYTDVFGYNAKGDITSYSRKYSGSIEQTYTAEKITENKYIFKDKSNDEYLTVIFDETGYIVSTRYANGYVNEHAFSYDKNGVPSSLKQLDVTPSGSNRILDFKIDFTNKTTCQMTPIGENSDVNVYYEATYNIIE